MCNSVIFSNSKSVQYRKHIRFLQLINFLDSFISIHFLLYNHVKRQSFIDYRWNRFVW